MCYLFIVSHQNCMVVGERRCSTLLIAFTLVYCNALELHVYGYTTFVPHTMLEDREARFPSHSEDFRVLL